MPVGSISAFAPVVQSVLATNPKSILDLGIGNGMNGAGIYNWYSKECVIEGVEVFRDYDSLLWYVYHEVYEADIFQFLSDTERTWDMVIMTDVLEHFPKEKGREVLKLIEKVTLKAAVVTTPAVWFEQGPVNGNPFEEHHCLWTVEDFQKEGWGIVESGAPDWLGHQMIIADYIVK